MFWENEIDTNEQFEKFMKLDTYLIECGYTNFFVFDNFGNYLCQCTTMQQLFEINKYLFRMTNKKSTRTFYYVDILGCKEHDKEKCSLAIETYLKNI